MKKIHQFLIIFAVQTTSRTWIGAVGRLRQVVGFSLAHWLLNLSDVACWERDGFYNVI